MRFHVLFAVTVAIAALTVKTSTVFAQAEPTYTGTLPGNLTLHLGVTAQTGADGKKTFRVLSRPQKTGDKPDVFLDSTLIVGADKKPQSCRLELRLPPLPAATLEAKRRDDNAFLVQTPAQAQSLRFGAPLVAPLIGYLFIGRQYDWKKGGTQTFTQFADLGVPPTEIATVKLTGDGTETVELAEGPVVARKLRYEATPPGSKTPQTSLFHIGPSGEVVKASSVLFGLPLEAKGAAKASSDGLGWETRYGTPTQTVVILLRADRKGPKSAPTGYDVRLGIERGPTFVSAAYDSRYQLKHVESRWREQPLVAEVGEGVVNWKLPASPPQAASTPSGRAWFQPMWMVTEAWENGQFAQMTVGETRTGDYLPLAITQGVPTAFTLERLPDVTAQNDGETLTLRHYQMKEQVVTDLYTDGTRLIALLASNDLRIIRDGWETWATAQKKPESLIR